MEKKLRIIDYPWQIAHQYEMGKFPFAKFFWLCQRVRSYNNQSRGDMINNGMFELVPYYSPNKYDVAILHLDQDCLDSDILKNGKGRLYRDLNLVIKDIPKIVIMHGTPYYPEKFSNKEEMIIKVKELVGDNYFVVNSHTAARQWQIPQTKTIIHGMDENDFFDLPKKPRVITVISPGGFPAYYDREFLADVKKELARRGIKHYHVSVDYKPKNFNDYRRFLGESLIYFNPTKESPMPRARTEAMFSGCCILTTPWQDADQFIKNGQNGFLVERDSKRVADLCEHLIANQKKAVQIGRAGKETARQLFNSQRYQKDWADYLSFVIEDYQQKKIKK